MVSTRQQVYLVQAYYRLLDTLFVKLQQATSRPTWSKNEKKMDKLMLRA